MFAFRRTFALGLVVTAVSQAAAITVPFTESFSNDAANWRDAAGVVANWSAAGGADGGGYVSAPLNFQSWLPGDTPVIHRGEQAFGSSGGELFGNWPSSGVTEFSVAVRHNAPLPLNFFSRFATNTPGFGAVAVEFAPVLPNTWTTISFPISAASPKWISFEAGNFDSVFVQRDITRVQVGISVPAALAGQNVSFGFDIDRASIVPEPAAAGLLLTVALVLFRRR